MKRRTKPMLGRVLTWLMAALLVAGLVPVLPEAPLALAEDAGVAVELGGEGQPSGGGSEGPGVSVVGDEPDGDTVALLADDAEPLAVDDAGRGDGPGGDARGLEVQEDFSADTAEAGDDAQDDDPSLATQSVSVSNPRVVAKSGMTAGQVSTWDCVWFGSYPQTEVAPGDSAYAALQGAAWDANGDATVGGKRYRRISKSDTTYSGYWSDDGYGSAAYRYFRYEPIKWRVLEASGSTALVVADRALDDQRYNTHYTSVTWATSSVRSWLNGYGTASNQPGTDYSLGNFLGTAFSSGERSAILTTDVANADNTYYGTAGGTTTKDKVFLLSEAEVHDTSHGFASGYSTSDEARRCKPTDFAHAMGATRYNGGSYDGNCWWCLRSPGSNPHDAAGVGGGGFVGRSGVGVNNDAVAIRPALNLNLASPHLSWAGTVSSNGDVDEQAAPYSPVSPGDPVDPDDPSSNIANARVYINGQHSDRNVKVEWTGGPIEPSISVEVSSDEPFGTKLGEGVDYSVMYFDNVKLGTATVVVTGMGSYTGSKTVTFQIIAGSALSHQSEFELCDVWRFGNSVQSIPYKFYRKLFGPIWGWAIYLSKNCGYSKGVCYGMVATAIASHEYSYPNVGTYRNSNSSAASLHDVGMDWKSSQLGMTAIESVMCAHASLNDPSVQRELCGDHMNDITGLVNAVLDSVGNNGEPVSIYVGDEDAHELLATGVGDNSSLLTEIKVYDCNAPNFIKSGFEFGSLYVYKDADGRYTSWEYTPYWYGSKSSEHTYSSSSSTKHDISWCTPGAELSTLFERNGNYHPKDYDSLLITDDILDKDVRVDTKKGTVTLNRGNEDLVLHVTDIDSNESAFGYRRPSVNWLNVGNNYAISNMSKGTSFTAASEAGGMSFKSSSGKTIDVSLSTETGRGVGIEQAEGSRFEVEFFEGYELERPATITISGTGGDVVEARSTGGGIDVSGASELVVRNDDDKVTRVVGLDEGETYTVIPGDSRIAPEVVGSNSGVAASKVDTVDISSAIVMNVIDREYTGSPASQSPLVKVSGKTLEEGWDYSISYENNVAVGAAKMIIEGRGIYVGRKDVVFYIGSETITSIELNTNSYVYDGKAKEPKVIVKTGSGVIGLDKYDVTYANNINAGTATVTVVGKRGCSGTRTAEFKINPATITSVTAKIPSYAYDGTAKKPDLIVRAGSLSVPPSGYTVTYKGNVNVGTATVTVKGKGNYTGTKSGAFEILPNLSLCYGVDNSHLNVSMINSASDFDYIVRDDGTVYVYGYYGASDVVVVPSEIEGHKVTALGGCFNSNRRVKEVYLPDTVTETTSEAFRDCSSLECVNLGSIKRSASHQGFMFMFWGCASLKRITMSDMADFPVMQRSDFDIIDKDALNSLEHIYLGSSMGNVALNLFFGDSLKTVEVGAGNPLYSSHGGVVYSADGKALKVMGTAYEGEYTVIDGCEEIAGGAFAQCGKLTNVRIPASVKKIYDSSFHDANPTITTPRGSFAAKFAAEKGMRVVYEGDVREAQTITASDKTVEVGKTVNLGAKTSGDGKLTYKSSDAKVATVSAKGVVTGVSVGVAKMTVTASETDSYKKATKTVTVTVTQPAPSFSDVTDKTAHADDISWLAAQGISKGWDMPDGTVQFRPYANVARADMAAFLFRLARSWGIVADGWKPAGTASFGDVTAKTAHYDEIMWLAESGISQGWAVKGGKEFRPYANVARADMAAFLNRLAQKAGIKEPTGGGVSFKDVTAKTAHAEDISWLAATGVSKGWSVSGGYEFRPLANVARADMAAFLHRLDGLR